MEGYPNFKLQNERVPCIDCGSNVRPRQEALQCDQCSQWQHRLCNTSKTFFSNCIAVVYYLTPQIINRKIKKCRILKALSISSVTHTTTHCIISNATTKYEKKNFCGEKQ